MRLRIIHRIFAICLVALAGIGAIAWFYADGEEALRRELELMASSARQVDASREAQLEIAHFRTEILSLAATRDAAALDRAVERSLALRIADADFAAQMEGERLAAAIASATGAYVAALRAAGVTEDDGLKGALRAAVHGIEDRLKTLIKAGAALEPLMVEMLMLRRHEKDFMLRGDPKYQERFAKTIGAFKERVGAAPLAASDATAVTALADEYAARFAEWSDADLQARAAAEATLQATDAATAALDALAADQQEAAAAANAAASTAMAETREGIFGAIAAVAAGVLGLALLIGRSISAPLSKLGRAVARIAEGDHGVETPGVGRGDEVGSMARAIEKLRQASARVAAMDAEKAESDARAAAAKRAMIAELTSGLGDVVEAAAAGDFGRRVNADLLDDEFAALARGLNRLLDTLQQGLSEVARTMASVADGDLSARVGGRFEGAFAELQDNVNQTVDRLAELVSRIADTTGSMRGATGSIVESADDLASRAERQAASLEEIAATMEQIASTVKANAESAHGARQMSGELMEQAQNGREIADKAVAAVKRIEESAGSIADFIGLIDSISFQTNLLALNAAVEAARAGDAGKGFAVVAQEVRMLAQRSSDAAKDIRSQIERSNQRVAEGVSLVEGAGESIDKILTAIERVTTAIRDISTASEEQAGGVGTVTASINEMDTITQRNAAIAEQSAAAARALSAEADALTELVSVFRGGARVRRAA